MSTPAGKASPAFFDRAIRPHLGQHRRDVVVGPRTGVDVGVVRLPTGGVLLSTTDPLYIEPRLGWEQAAWFAFHILASDLTTTGCRPDWATIDLDVPVETPDHVLETILRVFHREARRLGTAIITGHTGRYAGCAFPIVGSGTLLAATSKTGYVTTRKIPPGAELLVVRTAALEATGMLATFFPDRIRDGLGRDLLRRARSFTSRMSTVPDALRAARVGLRKEGVWAMHDATEGGVRAAAWEMALASSRGLDVDFSEVWVDPTARAVAGLFGFDPLDVSSEGTLLVAADPGRVQEVTSALRAGGASVSQIGRFTPARGGIRDRGKPFQPNDRESYRVAVPASASFVARRRRGRRVPAPS
ncbi:MAG: AIR synthase-related protein [Thermoplasmata archaeon]